MHVWIGYVYEIFNRYRNIGKKSSVQHYCQAFSEQFYASVKDLIHMIKIFVWFTVALLIHIFTYKYKYKENFVILQAIGIIYVNKK